MPIIQNRDVQYLYKRYRYYLQAFKAKSNCVPVVTYMYRNRSFCVVNETAQVRISACFFFFSVFVLFVCVCVEIRRRVCSFSAYNR